MTPKASVSGAARGEAETPEQRDEKETDIELTLAMLEILHGD